ncbi:cell division protein FtsQ/DivIB [Effusibacillus consociatus]|uniref:Cell division protein FtsQ/DivIB n=2 Tax=Effusibacillus consociatus TaxID=1117041 RepID=A0ABV9Q3N2_9BACL
MSQNSRSSKKAIFLLICFTISIAVIVFFNSPMSKVRSITVIGNQQVSIDQITSVSGLQAGMNWWKVDSKDVNRRLTEQIPLILEADVEVKFPGNIVIAVAEKSVSALLIHEGVSYRLLNDGTVFDKTNSTTGIPIVRSERTFPVEVGKRISDPDVQKFCTQIVKVDKTLLQDISDFNLSNSNLWYAHTVDKFKIVFPSGDVSTTLNIYRDFKRKKLQDQPPRSG